MAGLGYPYGHFIFSFPNGDLDVARARLSEQGVDNYTGLGGSALQYITARSATLATRCCGIFTEYRIDFNLRWVQPGQPSSPEEEGSSDSGSDGSLITVAGGSSTSAESDATLQPDSSSSAGSPNTVHGESSTSGVLSPPSSAAPPPDQINLSDSSTTSDSAVSSAVSR